MWLARLFCRLIGHDYLISSWREGATWYSKVICARCLRERTPTDYRGKLA